MQLEFPGRFRLKSSGFPGSTGNFAGVPVEKPVFPGEAGISRAVSPVPVEPGAHPWLPVLDWSGMENFSKTV